MYRQVFLKHEEELESHLCTWSDRYSSGACSVNTLASATAGGGVGKPRLDIRSLFCRSLVLFLLEAECRGEKIIYELVLLTVSKPQEEIWIQADQSM